MSLSNLFDIQNANDLLKNLLNILNEYEQSKDETYKPKMVRHVQSSMPCFHLTRYHRDFSDLPRCINGNSAE